MSPVKSANFVMSMSYLAKNAAAWAGDTAHLIGSDLRKPDDPVPPETLERCRAEMLKHLNFATGQES